MLHQFFARACRHSSGVQNRCSAVSDMNVVRLPLIFCAVANLLKSRPNALIGPRCFEQRPFLNALPWAELNTPGPVSFRTTTYSLLASLFRLLISFRRYVKKIYSVRSRMRRCSTVSTRGARVITLINA
jgi:hypothetical protein